MDTTHQPEEQSEQKNLAKPIPGNVPIKIPNTTIAPYCYSGLLEINFPNNETHIGTGILISSGDTSETLYVLTSGNNLYYPNSGGKATKIKFLRAYNDPDSPFEPIDAADWYYPDRFIGLNNNENYNYGLIKLKQSVRTNGLLPVLTVKTTDQLYRLSVQLNGYGFYDENMSGARGLITEVDEQVLRYPISTTIGSSGSAIMDMNNRDIVGIHTRSTNRELNQGLRITQDLKQQIESWMR
jgi:V8-like Glu-specific endopeptidase